MEGKKVVFVEDENDKENADGAKVPFLRSEKTSSDFATTRDVLDEVLDNYKKEGIEIENYACLYPTAPFITAERLKDTYLKFLDSGKTSLMPVIRFSFPPQRGCKIVNGSLEYVWPEYKNSRSQDLEPMYHDCGQFYFNKNTNENNGIFPYLLPEIEVQDIDNIEDWEIAEVKYQILKQKNK